ncbi:MAG TPA: hypothetical protein VE309_00140 [Caulobacteraceae bacterium]|nr:hypothetical protein [Caulobacteraceae bacterium]
MKTLKPILLGAAAIALLSAAPTFAQSAFDEGVDANAVVAGHGNWTLKQREDWLSRRVDLARDDRSISHDEYDRIHDQIDGIRDQENHMRGDHDGQLTDNETAQLEANLNAVADRIHWDHEDAFRRPW